MKKINASIITIGDELLIGQTLDTNSAWMAQELNKIGIWVKRRVAVGDTWDDIWNALDTESKESVIIFITGGLGPTGDDLTKPLLCKYFGGKMIINENAQQHIKDIFTKLNRPMLERNLKQAEVPDVCTVLHNARGTAPGMWFSLPDPIGVFKNISTEEKQTEIRNKIFISLPGVPYEMKGLMIHEVLPRLQKEFVLPAIVHKTIFTAGMGESFIADRIMGFETSLPTSIKLAYLPAYGMVRLRLTSMGEDKNTVEQALLPYFNKLKKLLNDVLVSDHDEELETVVGNMLKANAKTMATAESCTGGYIAHLITSVPGSSAYYNGSVISYSNESKEQLLNVSSDVLNSAGAVSSETVIQMVKGVLKKMNADFAIATSGIMGPGGGSVEKPVGTVWIAAGDHKKVITQKMYLRFDRIRNIEMTAQAALNLLRKFILEMRPVNEGND